MIKKFGKPGLTVEVRNNNVDGALRVMKKKLQREGFYSEMRKKEFFRGKSETRRLEKAAGRRRYLRNQQKLKESRGY